MEANFQINDDGKVESFACKGEPLEIAMILEYLNLSRKGKETELTAESTACDCAASPERYKGVAGSSINPLPQDRLPDKVSFLAPPESKTLTHDLTIKKGTVFYVGPAGGHYSTQAVTTVGNAGSVDIALSFNGDSVKFNKASEPDVIQDGEQR